jgi:hypothetical protein
MKLRKGYAKATEKFIYSPCSLRVGATAVETPDHIAVKKNVAHTPHSSDGMCA